MNTLDSTLIYIDISNPDREKRLSEYSSLPTFFFSILLLRYSHYQNWMIFIFVKWPPASWKRYSWDHLWNIGNLFRDINYATLIKYLCQDRQSSSRMFVTSRYRRVLWMHYLENGYRFLFIYRARSPLRLYLMYTTSKRILSNRRYMHIIT